jgi:hypothetical protein
MHLCSKKEYGSAIQLIRERPYGLLKGVSFTRDVRWHVYCCLWVPVSNRIESLVWSHVRDCLQEIQ